MNLLEQLKSVLCDPTGKCCIQGSDEDRAIVDRALQALTAQLLQQEPVAWLYPEGFKALQDGKCWTAYPTKHEDCIIPLYAAPQPPAPAPMQQGPVLPPAYETTIAARELPRGAPFAEFATQPLTDAELHDDLRSWWQCAIQADTRRLDALAENSWDLRCFDMPTGADDADIGWRVIEHHEAKPHERTVAEIFRDDPRQALDAAIEAAHTIKDQHPE